MRSKFFLFLLISNFFYGCCTWAQISPHKSSAKRASYTYEIFAMKAAKQFVNIGGMKGTNFLNRGKGSFFFSDSGDIAFFVETNSTRLSENSYILFRDRTALSYPGRFISGLIAAKDPDTWLTVGINAAGDVFYRVRFENGQYLGTAYVLNNEILYRTPKAQADQNDDVTSSNETQTNQDSDPSGSSQTGIVGFPMDGGPGFTIDGRSAIPVTVQVPANLQDTPDTSQPATNDLGQKTEWLINGILQDGAPIGAIGDSAPISGNRLSDYAPVGKTGIYVDDIFYKVFGLRNC